MPASGENRILGMVEGRPDWVVSRQRAWGVPITVFRNKETGEVIPSAKFAKSKELMARITQAFAKTAPTYGSPTAPRSASSAASSMIPRNGSRCATSSMCGSIPAPRMPSRSKTRSTSRPRGPQARALGVAPARDWADRETFDRVMYLEGSDQHRGWFQSSLLESCGTRGRAPYDVVLTHGFVLDEKGRKMSKSDGNVVAPQDVMKQSGADILRLWVAASDYSDDLRIGPEIFKTSSRPTASCATCCAGCSAPWRISTRKSASSSRICASMSWSG